MITIDNCYYLLLYVLQYVIHCYTIASYKNPPRPKAHRHPPFLAESPEGGRRFTYYDSCYAFAAARCPAWEQRGGRCQILTQRTFNMSNSHHFVPCHHDGRAHLAHLAHLQLFVPFLNVLDPLRPRSSRVVSSFRSDFSKLDFICKAKLKVTSIKNNPSKDSMFSW